MIKLSKYHRKAKLVMMTSGLCTILFLLMGENKLFKDIASTDTTKYIIKINGNEVKEVTGEDNAKNLILNTRYKEMCKNNKVTYMNPKIEIVENTVRTSADKSDDSKQDNTNVDEENSVSKALSDSEMVITNKEEAVLLNVDGNISYLKNTDEVIDVLNQVKNKYDKNDEFKVEINDNNKKRISSYTANCVKNDEEDNSELREIGYAENIEIISTYVDKEDIQSTEDVYNELTLEKDTESRYEVVEGDCISTIANDHGMYVKDFLELNKDSYLSEDSTIYIGDVYKIMVPKPELSVETVERSTKKEYYRAEPVYVDDDSLYQGETKTISKGKKGYRKVTIDTTYVDGIESSHKVVDEEVKKEAVAAVIARGTAIKPSYIRPISGGRTTSYFGYRAIFGDFHLGQDWAVPTGTSVYASCGGTVASAGWNGSYGLSVLITHPNGVQTRYGHLSEISVSAGQTVEQGQRIGFSGSTGNSTGPHLHFEVIVNGQVVDPLTYVSEY